jgi:2-amino-4-hydroxy-6-hydroxymethyldihydropteridine diphosphokinase
MQLDSKKVYLLLGSNLGDRKRMITEAIEHIEARVGKVFARSSWYETAAWGNTDQPAFFNLALGVSTSLSPVQVLEEVLDIEIRLGRVRKEHWGARLIDIDIILYENEIISIENRLHIPHPEMQNRKFVLQPLSEIAGDCIHPVLKQTISNILSNLTDNLTVSKV